MWSWWQRETQRWAQYDQHTTNQLEGAFYAQQLQINVSASTPRGTLHYSIDLLRMVQINQTTRFERPVKRDPLAGSATTGVWEYEDLGSWHQYGFNESEHLTSVQQLAFPKTVLWMIRHGRAQSYEIDFAQMTQTNTYTRFSRRIRLHQAPTASTSGRSGAALAASIFAVVGAETSAAASSQSSSVDEILKNAVDCTKDATDADQCPVCIEGFSANKPALRLPKCKGGHYIHGECWKDCWSNNRKSCPTCNVSYALRIGTQPQGSMTTNEIRQDIPGFPAGSGTIQMTFSFPNGIQGPQHENPGHPYTGTTRVGYLPGTTEGREVLALLRRAFDQHLIFKVGTSITTQQPNTTCWGSIHIKTSLRGGPYGYPDPNYLNRVKEELRAFDIK